MFPAPIDKASPPKRYLYYVAVGVALLAWLLAAPGGFVDLDSLGGRLEYGKLLGLAQRVEIFKLHRDLSRRRH